MRITPMDIRQQQFHKKLFRGFDRSEVEAFLEEVAGDYEDLVRENNLLKDQLAALEDRVRGMEEEERLIRETLQTAQKLAEEHKEQARKTAELIVRQAEVMAENLMEAARAEEAKIKSEILALKRQRRHIGDSLRSTLEQYGKLIDADFAETE